MIRNDVSRVWKKLGCGKSKSNNEDHNVAKRSLSCRTAGVGGLCLMLFLNRRALGLPQRPCPADAALAG